MKPEVTVILGPTAAGKTDYAIKLAKQRDGMIISADSRQVYAGMNIGTAKPSKAWAETPHDVLTPDSVQGVDHFLFNIQTPDHPVTLADWQTAARQVIDHILSQHKHPILVGGTMLYIDSIVYNYSLPRVAPNTELRAKLEQEEAGQLYQQLLAQDPEASSYIEPSNKRRIIRALEVMQATETSFSSLRQQQPSPYQFSLIGLFPGWEILTQRIQQRQKTMFTEGLLTETQKLLDAYGISLPLLQTINYTQAVKVLNEEYTFEEALQESLRVNLRYARRQMSWWRRHNTIHWI